MAADIFVSESELNALEAALLNASGNVSLHEQFRALFALKALKNEQAVRIISKGLITSGIIH
jgi:deoxyhypusine monooxygenase